MRVSSHLRISVTRERRRYYAKWYRRLKEIGLTRTEIEDWLLFVARRCAEFRTAPVKRHRVHKSKPQKDRRHTVLAAERKRPAKSVRGSEDSHMLALLAMARELDRMRQERLYGG